MANSIRKLWLSIGLAILLIFASSVFTDILSWSNVSRYMSPLILLALVFGSFSFLSFVEMLRLEYLSSDWKGATLQLIISALLAISFGTDSGWIAGLGLSVIGAMLILPIGTFNKETRKESMPTDNK